MDGLWRFLGVNSLDDLIAGFGAPSDDIKIPNESPLPPSLVGTLQPSVVRISGPACDNEKSGSGFVVNNGLVVTNAHVVAGVSKITVTSDEDDYSAVIVGFDAHVDLAVLRVAGLKAKPLPMAVPEDGEVGAVLGYPGGGALSVQPYRLDSTIIANTADIYGGGPVRRSVTIIGSNVRAGDSGGPLVTAGGEVHGVVFAVASDHPGVAYAIGAAEIIETLSKVSDTALDSGACT
jgi:S1-C subfamily serine protease